MVKERQRQASVAPLNEQALTSFRTGLCGKVIQPHDAAYERARRVNNFMIDRRPRMIVQCRDVADVISAVTFARERGWSMLRQLASSRPRKHGNGWQTRRHAPAKVGFSSVFQGS